MTSRNKKILHTIYEETARRFPARIAIRQGGRSVTYGKLARATGEIAATLRQKGVGRDVIVGVALESSIEYVAAIIAVMKAGGVFFPIDMTLPEKRLAYMLTKTLPEVLIGARDFEITGALLAAAGFDHTTRPLLLLDAELQVRTDEKVTGASGIRKGELSEAIPLPEPDDSCYIMYTSGSTGLPKAILGRHKSLSHFIHWEVGEFGFDEHIRVTQLPPVTFDASLRDIFVPLICGGMLCIPDRETRTEGKRLVDWLEREGITLVHCVPSLFRMFTKELGEREKGQALLPSLDYVLMAGEPLYGKDVTGWRDSIGERVGLVNLYGPTEATLVKTCYRIPPHQGNSTAMLPVGHPISNTAILITKGGRLCDVGEIGDIFIKTPFLTKGYYHDPELTKKSFVPNPLTGDTDDIVYKTGDMGRYLPDRSIEFIGRLDSQVKINGIRIELGEIENALRENDCIEQAVVLSHKVPEGDPVIVCYYTERKATDTGAVSNWLRHALPSSMVPSFYVRLEEFPLTINGKIDRKTLPKPEELIYEGIAYEAPADEKEELLARIWGEILHLKKVGVNNPFFQIGGHSLTATRVLSRIYRETGVEIRLKDFFENQTIGQLARFLREKREVPFTPLPVLSPQDDYALSHAQRRLWILDRMEEESTAYSLPGLFLVQGELHIPVLRNAFLALMERHESLRTTFIETREGPRQKVHDYATFLDLFAVGEVDFSAAGDGEERALAFAKVQAAIPFDLSRGPLLRVAVIALSQGRRALFFNMHHIIGDAWSFDVLARDVWSLYDAGREERERPLVPLRVQYRDYAAWQNALLAGKEAEEQARYWRDKLSGAEAATLNLPCDFPRPPLQTYGGETLFFTLEEGVTQGLAELARQHDASMFMVLLALVKTLLHRYTGQDDIIVGSPVANRNHPDLEDQIGFFANTLALRDPVGGDETFAELLARVKKTTIEAYDHQHYPFDRLVDELNLVRDPGRAPLFDVMLVYQEEGAGADGWLRAGESDLRIKPLELESTVSRFDLTFEMVHSGSGLRIGINYNTALFRSDTIERMASHVTALAESVLAGPQEGVGKLPMLSAGERLLVTETFNNTRSDVPADRSIVDMFREQATRNPDRIAVVTSTGDLTYGELQERAAALARALLGQGLKPEEVVGLLVDRNEWSLVGLLGILMAGGVYLPLDPAYPGGRINYLLRDSGCTLVLREGKFSPRAKELPADVLQVDVEDLLAPGRAPSVMNFPSSHPLPASPAYMIYTSGSTGLPKGVLVEHGGFVNMSLHQIATFGVTAASRVLQFASPSFDASLSEIFMALLSGAAVVTLTREMIDDPRLFLAHLAEKQVTHVTLPPLYLNALDREGLAGISTLITAGEAPNREDALYFSRRTRYFNAYGPTECSVCAAIQEVLPDGDYGRGIPIGRPIANTAIYILNDSFSPAPVGVTGELCLAGAGLARGYHNRPELTAERFVEHPFRAGERLYRTGDLGCWLPDGTILLSGRNDEQIKISGYRVEPGEIKNTLLRHPAVREAVVVASNRGSGTLAAYFTAREPLDARELRSYLTEFLPPPLVPRFLMQLEQLPLTLQGKVDRKALPEPEASRRMPDVPREMPRNSLERQLLAIWQEVLEDETLGIRDNFFESGGNSLHALQLISRITAELAARVPVKALFLNPTVAALSATIADMQGLNVSHSVRQGEAAQPLSPALTIAEQPLLSRYREGKIRRVDAAALICLPDWLLDQSEFSKERIIGNICRERPVLSSITETFIGRIASILLPRFASEVFSEKAALEKQVVEAMQMADFLGATTVSLTGNLPLAMDLGFDLVDGMEGTNKLPAMTTGQATVAAAMVMTMEKTLRSSGRQLNHETIGIAGLNTIGAATLCLMLACLPHPRKIIMADAYNNLLFAAVLSRELSDCGFEGPIEIMKASETLPPEFYEASLIIGATNVPGIIEVDRLRPGTITIGESGQQCFSRERAIERLEGENDVLFTEGDLLRLPSPSTCLLYLPGEVETSLRKSGMISFLNFNPLGITGCVLSGLLSHYSPDLKPTIGEVDGDTCLRHLTLLRRLEFTVEGLHFQGYGIGEDRVELFKERFGESCPAVSGMISEER